MPLHTHVYEPDTYVPLALIDTTGNKVAPKHRTNHPSRPRAQFHWYHTNASGAPEELTDQENWRARYKTGGSLALKDEPEGRFQQGLTPQMQDQPLRMQGSMRTAKRGCTTTLSVTMIRMSAGSYPKPDWVGRGIESLPICANPLSWIDPWGWSCFNQRLGRYGEKQVVRYLKGTGYKKVFSVQNRSGHGLDVVGQRADENTIFLSLKPQCREISIIVAAR